MGWNGEKNRKETEDTKCDKESHEHRKEETKKRGGVGWDGTQNGI